MPLLGLRLARPGGTGDEDACLEWRDLLAASARMSRTES